MTKVWGIDDNFKRFNTFWVGLLFAVSVCIIRLEARGRVEVLMATSELTFVRCYREESSS